MTLLLFVAALLPVVIRFCRLRGKQFSQGNVLVPLAMFNRHTPNPLMGVVGEDGGCASQTATFSNRSAKIIHITVQKKMLISKTFYVFHITPTLRLEIE